MTAIWMGTVQITKESSKKRVWSGALLSCLAGSETKLNTPREAN